MLPSSLALSNKENESFVCMAQKSIFGRKCKWERPRGSKITNFLGREVAGEGRWGLVLPGFSDFWGGLQLVPSAY